MKGHQSAWQHLFASTGNAAAEMVNLWGEIRNRQSEKYHTV